MELNAAQVAVLEACFSYANRRRAALGPQKRLAYYTTAETALRVIENGTFWLRNPKLMNDYAEVVHAQLCIDSVLNSPNVAAIANATLNEMISGGFERVKGIWEALKQANQYTFIACVSEIEKDDTQGRLSMWRAYGGRNGVALVLKNDLLQLDTSFINTFSSPVLYGAIEHVEELLLEIFQKLFAVKDQVRAAGENFVLEAIKDALNYAMVSIKHPGFEEEREWRMVHHYNGDNDAYLTYKSAVVRGNAEVLCEVNLRSHEALRPRNVFEKVIVGPCQFPENTAEAIRLAFRKTEETAPDIVISGIPLRHS